jgi:hypothetical protein
MKNIHNRKKGFVGIKLDMAKAYDRIEWDFLESTLITMGFPTKMITSIMLCVRTVTFSVLINGTPTTSFRPTRGIRQGDPLSPYLFIICAEVLSGLLSNGQDRGNIHGISIARNAPPISHLLFADDSIIFCRANHNDAANLRAILDEYQRVSGQSINLDKSEMVFSPNISEDIKASFHQHMPILISNNITKYLGLPTQIGKSKNQVFQFLMDRIWSKLKGWKEKNLSFAGRGVLIRAVARAIPTYVTSCYRIPHNICDKIESAVCNFWWGGKDGHKKIHWKSKQNLFKSKYDGGLGFRSLSTFNEALLAKQVWRLHSNPNSLIARCLKARYYPQADILQAPIGHRHSYIWRSIHSTKWIIKKGGCWKVGNGQSINIWEDQWLPYQNGFKILTPNPGNSNITLVKDLIVEGPIGWNHALIDNIFLDFEGNQIKQLPLIPEVIDDKFMWRYTKEGNYTVKSGYNTIKTWEASEKQGPSNVNNTNRLWKKIWSLKTIPRHQTLLWRILNEALPVRSELIKRGIHCSMICPRCYAKIETSNHVLWDCPIATKVWFGSQLNINTQAIPTINFQDWLSHMIITAEEDITVYIASIIYGLWFARNKKVFEDKDITEDVIISTAWKVIQDFKQTKSINYSPDTSFNHHQTGNNNRMHNHNNQIRWTKPRTGLIKINCDANLQRDGIWGLGAAYRDDEGQILAAATWQTLGFNDPVTAEAMDIYNAMHVAIDCCF